MGWGPDQDKTVSEQRACIHLFHFELDSSCPRVSPPGETVSLNSDPEQTLAYMDIVQYCYADRSFGRGVSVIYLVRLLTQAPINPLPGAEFSGTPQLRAEERLEHSCKHMLQTTQTNTLIFFFLFGGII